MDLENKLLQYQIVSKNNKNYKIYFLNRIKIKNNMKKK